MNRAILIGRLTKEPEARATTNGTSVCGFTIAVQRRFTGKDGERETDFIPVKAWSGLADTCIKYLHKGSMVAVSGSIQTRSYEAQDGTKRYVTEIVADEVQFLDTKRNNQQTETKEESSDIEGFTVIDDDSELPF